MSARMLSGPKALAVVALLVLCLAASAAASDVEQLTAENFKSKVLDDASFWMVEFYAPWCGHCKNLAPHWEKAATQLKGKARLGAVDATVHSGLAQQYGVQGYPTIKVFGKDKRNPTDYPGGREAAAIVSFAIEQAKGFAVTAPVTSVKYSALHTFFTLKSTRTAPKLVFLADPADRPSKSGGIMDVLPSWAGKLAGKIKAKRKDVKIVVVAGKSATKLSNRLGLTAPALIGVPAAPGTEQLQYAVATTDKGRRLSGSAAASFVKTLLSSAEDLDLMPLPAFPPPSGPKARTPLKLTSKVTANNLGSKCLNKKGVMCVLVLGAAESVLDTIAKPLAKTFRLDKLTFAMVDNGASVASPLREALGLERMHHEFDLAIVKTGKKKRFAVFNSHRTTEDVEEFINEVMGGNVRFKPLRTSVESIVAAASASTDDNEGPELCSMDGPSESCGADTTTEDGISVQDEL